MPTPRICSSVMIICIPRCTTWIQWLIYIDSAVEGRGAVAYKGVHGLIHFWGLHLQFAHIYIYIYEDFIFLFISAF